MNDDLIPRLNAPSDKISDNISDVGNSISDGVDSIPIENVENISENVDVTSLTPPLPNINNKMVPSLPELNFVKIPRAPALGMVGIMMGAGKEFLSSVLPNFQSIVPKFSFGLTFAGMSSIKSIASTATGASQAFSQITNQLKNGIADELKSQINIDEINPISDIKNDVASSVSDIKDDMMNPISDVGNDIKNQTNIDNVTENLNSEIIINEPNISTVDDKISSLNGGGNG